MVISNFNVMHTCRNFDAVCYPFSFTCSCNSASRPFLTIDRFMNGHLIMHTRENSISRDGEMSRESVDPMGVATEVSIGHGFSLVLTLWSGLDDVL